MIILIDTNVLLDVVQCRAGFYPHSSRVWTLVERKRVQRHLSAISFTNAFYILRKQIGAATALDAVRFIPQAFAGVTQDESKLEDAVQRTGDDLKDAIQAAAASRISADYLVTRDLHGFARLGIAAVTPEELLTLING
jgi:predicted nucleic acid-binding protein